MSTQTTTRPSTGAEADEAAPAVEVADLVKRYGRSSTPAVDGLSFAVRRGEVFGQLEHLIGAQGAAAVQGLLQSANKPAESTVATLIGLVVLLIGATTVFAELQSALDRIWRAPARAGSGVSRSRTSSMPRYRPVPWTAPMSVCRGIT